MRTISLSAAISLTFLGACAAPSPDEGARSSGGELAVSGGGGAGAGGGLGVAGGGSVGPTLSDRAYYFESLGSRCFDFGGQAWWALGSPVMIYTCNGTVAQQVRVKEIDLSHDVELRVQSLYCIGVRGGRVAVGQPLELQTCNGSAAQRFALDGDSVLMGLQASGNVTREVVVEPLNDASPDRTPLVVGTRDTSDAEYFRVQTVDSTNAPPTTGWVTVSSDAALRVALGIGWGAVIEVADTAPLQLAATVTLPAGVTLRGYRKHRNAGALVTYAGPAGDNAVVANADGTRITGLRFQGGATGASGILATTDAGQRIFIDHNELTGWSGGGGAVGIGAGDDGADEYQCVSAYTGALAYPRATNVRVLRNFVHDNPSYGIVTGTGAMILAQGNVEYLNQHSLASDPTRLSGYVAYDNFLLGPAIDSPRSSNQDFDAHGSDHPGSWYGGISGDYFDIGWNTFLQESHYDFNDRGTPCRFAQFHDNVSVQSQSNAVTTQSTKGIGFPGDAFNVADPMVDLGVADFDGDHVDDVFVGTGATWWFSSGGQSEWRLLNRMPEHASQLRFGDFDGDGRADVIAIHDGNVDVSWSGLSPWQTINTVGWQITDLAVGDFDGDHTSDLFLATGSEWFYAPGGRNWTVYAQSSAHASDVRLGDFTGDGKTDVFLIIGNQWAIVPGGSNSWQPLRTALTTSVAGLVVADFDGDGYADVARTSGIDWQYAARGWGGFVYLRSDIQNIATVLVGHFDTDAKADALEWSYGRFAVSSGATGAETTVSEQAMR